MKIRNLVTVIGVLFVLLLLVGCSQVDKSIADESNKTQQTKTNNTDEETNDNSRINKPINLEVGTTKGEIAPDFTLEDTKGNNVSLYQLRGKNLLVNFWATWCPPCKEEMPALDQFYSKYKDKDITVIGVNIGDSRSKVDEFLIDNGYSFPIWLDKDKEVAKMYNIFSIPSTFFINKDGIIEKKIMGGRSLEQFEELSNEIFN